MKFHLLMPTVYFNIFLALNIHTFGTKMRAIERKQQNISAKATKAKLASCCEAITMVTGAVIRHRTTTLYIDIPTYLESLICFTFMLRVS